MKKSQHRQSGVLLGWRNFAKVNAVEGIRYSKSLIADFQDFEKRKLSSADRRAILLRKYGRKP